MPWLITHTLDALNLEHVHKIYADKSKVKAQLAGFPVNVAVDLEPEEAQKMVRDIVAQTTLGHSVEVVGSEILRISDLR